MPIGHDRTNRDETDECCLWRLTREDPGFGDIGFGDSSGPGVLETISQHIDIWADKKIAGKSAIAQDFVVNWTLLVPIDGQTRQVLKPEVLVAIDLCITEPRP